jgi:hypothetical protein
MYLRATVRSSLVSSVSVPTSRTMASSLGKMPMTSELRLISRFTRWSGFVEAIWAQCSRGKRNAFITREEASLFFRLVSYRYGRGAMIITTNGSIWYWTELLAGDEVLATAILDRLLHRAHVLNIKG